MSLARLSLFFLCITLLVSCSVFEKVGHEIADGVVEVIDEEIPAMVGTGGHAIRDSVLNQATREELDSIVVDLLRQMTIEAEVMRDSLLGADMDRLLAKKLSIFGDSASVYARRIRNELMGPATRDFLMQVRGDLLGDSTLADMEAIRDKLLGPGSQKYFRAFVDTSFAALWEQYTRVIKPEIEEQLSFIQRWAWLLLILAAVLAAIIIWFVYQQKVKTARMLRMVTFQVHMIPDQSSYDELTRRVRINAQEQNLEPGLRKVLDKQGILGKESWVSAGTDEP